VADYSCLYELDCGVIGGTILFNDGEFGRGSDDDLYWITGGLRGLDGPTLRVNADDKPFGHGGIVHRSWKGPRHVDFEGSLIVQSVGPGGCQARFNEMEADLRTALESIIAPTSGVLSWTPTGGTMQETMTVFYEVPLAIAPTDAYQVRSFAFGLISEDPNL
jgi:hypothetical protein